jgi:hypothetical protein
MNKASLSTSMKLPVIVYASELLYLNFRERHALHLDGLAAELVRHTFQLGARLVKPPENKRKQLNKYKIYIYMYGFNSVLGQKTPVVTW